MHWLLLPSVTPILSCIALCTQFFTLVLVLYRLSKQASIPLIYTARPSLAVLPPLTCYQGTCCPLHPCATSPFMPCNPPSGSPPFTSLDISSAPDNPYGFSLLGYVITPTVLEPPSPRAPVSTAGLVPSGPDGGHVSSSGLLTSYVLLHLHPLLFCPISWCILFVVVFFWAPFCAFLRGLGVFNPCQSLAPVLIPSLFGRSGAVQAARPSPSPLPLARVFLIPYLSVLVVCGVRAQRIISLSWPGLIG